MTEDKLKAIRQQIEKGVVPSPEAVRNFLTWFGVNRRGSRGVSNIRQCLEAANLETDPDFEFAFIDGQISFVRAGSKKFPPIPRRRFESVA